MPFQQTNIFLQQKIIKVINMKEILFKLNDFCNANRIEYMVTGTTALAMLGVPSNPQDIDIKVFHLKEEQEAKLKEHFNSCLALRMKTMKKASVTHL